MIHAITVKNTLLVSIIIILLSFCPNADRQQGQQSLRVNTFSLVLMFGEVFMQCQCSAQSGNHMYKKASEYFRPVHLFSKYCGTYPGRRTSPKIWHYYFVYCVLLSVPILLFAWQLHLYIWAVYKDIVYFTAVLSLSFKVCTCLCLVYVPIYNRNYYRKLFDSINEAELLMFTSNMNQKQVPTKRCQLYSCFASTALVFSHAVVLYEVFGCLLSTTVGSFIPTSISSPY